MLKKRATIWNEAKPLKNEDQYQEDEKLGVEVLIKAPNSQEIEDETSSPKSERKTRGTEERPKELLRNDQSESDDVEIGDESDEICDQQPLEATYHC